MKSTIHRTAVITLIIFLSCGCGADHHAEWWYLGDSQPGKTPKIFGKDLVSTEEFELALSISPCGKEILFTRHPQGSNQNRILQVKYVGGEWLGPALAPFALDCRESLPNFSPDGKMVFVNSRRPLPPGSESDTPLNVWFAKKLGDGWSEPEFLGLPVSTIRPMYVTSTISGTIYTTGCRHRGIYRSAFLDGNYLPPERLPDEVNGKYWAGHPYIAPDESYVVFDSNVDDEGTKHIFVSHRRTDGSWSSANDLTEYLGFPSGSCPHVTFDGKYLFFSSNGDIYWVDASVLTANIARKATQQALG